MLRNKPLASAVSPQWLPPRICQLQVAGLLQMYVTNRIRLMQLALTRVQIIYVSLVTPLILAAFLEWILWLGAFLFGLCKVFQKAEHWSTRVVAVIMMVLFTLLRLASEHYAHPNRH